RRDDRQHATAAGFCPYGSQLGRHLQCRPADRGGDDEAGQQQDQERHCQYLSTLWTRRSPSFVRPSSATSSMRNANAWTRPPRPVTRSAVAHAVPPVASRSSTINTCWPSLTASE